MSTHRIFHTSDFLYGYGEANKFNITRFIPQNAV